MTDTKQPIDNKDNRDWYNLVAGQAVPDADPKTREEAQLLRQAVLNQDDPVLSEQDLEQGWQRLRAELIQQGVLEPEPHLPWWRRLSTKLSHWLSSKTPSSGLRWTSALATLAGIMICVQLLMPTQPPELIPKPFIVPQEIYVAEPEITAHRFATLIRDRNIPVLLVEEPSIRAWKVILELPEQPSKTLEADLNQYDILQPPPPERQLQVRFFPVQSAE